MVCRRSVLAVFSILMGILICSSLVFAVELYPLDEIVPGLRGVGKTIISGTAIEEFAVEVLGLVPQSPPLSDLILVEVSGEVMERSGGIALGMSGTPVYVEGRLMGAISHTFLQTDHRIGLVTAAADMFKIYDQLALASQTLPEGAVEVRSPLVIQGLNARNTRFLQNALAPYGVQLMPSVAGGGAGETQPPLEPGGMVGVQLLRGDFLAASFGTVTHVQEDGRFIAYGHPFSHLGSVDYFAAEAFVHYTLPSLEVPYKIVSLGSTIGAIKEDRAAGIGGVLGLIPQYVPATIAVWDKDSDLRREFYVESVAEADILIPLIISSAYQGVDATLDRVGGGTSFVRLEFSSEHLSQRMIRENLFYSDTDIAVWSLTDLLYGLELLVTNSLQEITLEHVQIDLEISEGRKTATIESANPSRFNVRAGESVDVEVLIRPYRLESETRLLRLKIPEDTAPGMLTVTVRSGAAGYYLVKPPTHIGILAEADDEEPIKAAASGAETLDVLISEYMERERNNEIVAEFYPFLQNYESEQTRLDEGSGGFENSYDFYGWNSSAEAETVRLSTQFVLDGMASFDLNIF